MQRFLLSAGIFLGSCLVSVSSPLFINSAIHDQQSSALIFQSNTPSQRHLLEPGAVRPQTTVTQGGNVEKTILILETRDNWITIYSGEGSLLYTVSTGGGTVLAERLKGSDLKDRFPELYDIVTGTAWAGETHTS